MTSVFPNISPHLPTSRLISYGTLTVGLSSFALYRYFRDYYRDGYKTEGLNTLEEIMKDNFMVVAAFNIVFCFLVSFVKSMQYFFFGSLRGTEPEYIREKLFQFLLSRAIILIGIINATRWSSLLGWTFWFGNFCCLYGFARLAYSRCENLVARYATSKRDCIRFCVMLVILLSCVWLNFAFGLKYNHHLSDVIPDAEIFGEISNSESTEEDGADESYQIVHVLVYIISDSILVSAIILRTLFTIGFNALDESSWSRRRFTFDKNRWLYYLNLIFDITHFSLHFLNHVHMLIWTQVISLLTPIICTQIFISYGCLARRIRKHFAYMEHVKTIQKEFPLESLNSNAEKSEAEPDLCSICWEPLRSWRRLPCRHCFHEDCLTSWIERDPSCPACRRQILPSNVPQRERGQRQETFMGNLMRDLFNVFDSDPVEQIIPPTTATAPTTDAPTSIRNVLVRLRIRNTPGYDFSIRVSLGPSRRILRRPIQTPPNRGDGQITEIPTEVGAGNVETPTAGDPVHEEQVIQSTTRSRFYRFDGSRYFSWLPTIDIEFSEIEQHLTSPGATIVLDQRHQHQQHQGPNQRRNRFLSRFRAPQSLTRHHQDAVLPQPLTDNLRAQGEQIAAAFPDLSLNAILLDLSITQIPEVTVENILVGRIRRDVPETPETQNETAQRNPEQNPAEETASVQVSEASVNANDSNVNDSDADDRYPEPPPVEPQDIESMTPAELLAYRRRQLLFRARNRFNEVRRRPWNRDLRH